MSPVHHDSFWAPPCIMPYNGRAAWDGYGCRRNYTFSLTFTYYTWLAESADLEFLDWGIRILHAVSRPQVVGRQSPVTYQSSAVIVI